MTRARIYAPSSLAAFAFVGRAAAQSGASSATTQQAADKTVSITALADPVSAEPVSWMPQATGWKVLAALVLLAVLWLLWRAARKWWRDRYRRDALAELRQLEANWQRDPANAVPVLVALPALIKRCALSAWPREKVAGCSGAAWASFLESHAGHALHGAQALNPLVRELQYQDEAHLARVSADDVRMLIDASREWIVGHVSA
ncbi:DUF4381 domain-containing protein [Variovorax dokdonensis]|uniref:DUF4381 domain-containing protein n=1 Tax=Variovorax dokdonensis TaxID=344883 RepID=A0ABT7NGZ8_9BURK|nr:DUF4381 domain-containing protein [Variovorax dokdonensis]MDM0047201.1 DUF4381 domain-containing protein [Variovorax dokdonensis]